MPNLGYSVGPDDESVSAFVARRKKKADDETFGKVELTLLSGDDEHIANALKVLNHLINTLGFEAFYEGQKQGMTAMGIDLDTILNEAE